MKNDNEKLKISKKIKEDISLNKYTTFKIGGRARYFLEAKSKDEIIEAIKWAKARKVPFFVLGGGSNVLVDDNNLRGLVIKMKNCRFCLRGEAKQSQNRAPSTHFEKMSARVKATIIEAEAGVQLVKLIKLSLKEGLSGLEWAAGIPGITVGGAIRGNAGAFGKFISDIVKEVEIFDAKNLKIKKLSSKDCGFGYKETIFKKNKNLIILSALLLLKKKNKKEIQKEIDYVLNYRRTRHPRQPSAGCVFKNKKLKIKNKKLINEFPELMTFGKGEIPAAWLIEQCGLEGKRAGGAQISEKHANFIVNLGNASSEDVKMLINLIKKEVKRKFRIELEEEISILPKSIQRS